jgi:prepilin-type N-terminal cleavage/methylation domain-containing protein
MTIGTSAYRRTTAGFSLIEVMVALVVLTIGIFAIIRLFPGGFLTILRTSELTQATGLAQEQIDAQKQLSSVAESVVALDPTNPGNILADIRSDTVEDESFASAAGNVFPYTDPYYVSNINHFLRVLGESFRISAPSSNSGGGQGAVYMLQRGPVRNTFATDALGNPSDSLTVRGLPLERTEQSSIATFNNPTGAALLVNDGQYAIDYKNLKVAFYPRVGTASRQYVFAYEYLKTVAGLVVIVPVTPDPAVPANTTITVPDVAAANLPPGVTNPAPVWQDLFGSPANLNGITKPADFDQNLGLHLNSDDVSRRFRYTPVAFDTDAYEYKWYSPQFASNANAGVNTGVLVFNPAGYSQVTPDSTGSQPLTARVDYTIFDNHIIHEDRAIPVSPPYDIRLSLQFIAVNGHVGDPDRTYDTLTTYNGLFRDFNAETPSVLIYNANTGDLIGSIGNGAPPPPLPLVPVRTLLEDRGGILRLNQVDVENQKLQGATVRVFYRTEKDWGVDLQKANAHYTQADTPVNVQYNSYYIGGSDAAKDGSPNRIYFPLCEAGKTVVLGEFFVSTNLPAPNNRLRFSNEAFQVNSDPGAFDTVGTRLMTFIDIGTQHAEAGTQAWVFDSQQTGRAVNNVRGGSMRVRVVWRDAKRWRRVENISFLAQPSLR